MFLSPHGEPLTTEKVRLERKYSHFPSSEKAGENDSYLSLVTAAFCFVSIE
jgi:hypothetical protein